MAFAGSPDGSPAAAGSDQAQGALERPHLLGRLATRFSGRVVTVVAGAGFGKTTLLAEAQAANRRSPRGTDCSVALRSSHAVASTLVRAFAERLSLGAVPRRATPDWLIEALVGLPLSVALVVDDLHLLPDGSEGFELVRRVVQERPSQLGVVLTSRTSPDIGLARLRALGMLDELGEDDLRFNDAEIARFAQSRGVDRDLIDGVSGWPALSEMVARARTAQTPDYLWEEVLEPLPATTRRHFAIAITLGKSDRAMLETVAEERVDITALASLPLVRRDGDALEVHRLWADVERVALDPATNRDVHRASALVHEERGEYHDAIEHLALASDGDGVCRVIAHACRESQVGTRVDLLERWRAFVPPDLTQRPEVLLLDGIRRRLSAPFAAETADLLRRAHTGLRERGDTAAEITAIAELAFVIRSRGEMEEFGGLVRRIIELRAAGNTDVEGFVRFGTAIISEQMDDDEGALAHFASIAPDMLTDTWWALVENLRTNSLIMLGRPAEAVTAGERALRLGGPEFLGGRAARATSRWWNQVERDSLDLLDLGDAVHDSAPMNLYLPAIQLAPMLAFAGRLDDARRMLGLAEPTDRSGLRPELRGLFAFARAALDAAAGHTDRAAAGIETQLASEPLSTPAGRRAARRFVALIHVLAPAVRPALDELELGPALAECRATAQLLESLRAGAVRRSALRDGLVRPLNALPAGWLAELAARLVDHDERRAVALATELVRVYGTVARDTLRNLRDDDECGSGAKQLLATVPAPPSSATEIRILGPVDVVIGGTASDATELRRERVRQLLCYLAVHRRASRDALASALWSDLDTEAARRNLRVNLTHLQRVLEPDRATGEPAFVLAQEGSMLRLADEPWVAVDADRFEAEIRQADDAERVGAHNRSLEHLEAALTFVRAEPLADVRDEIWATPLRMRLIAMASRASVRAGRLRHARGDHETAIRHATDALALEPWAEAAYQVLAAAHLALGDRASARRALVNCRRSLADIAVAPDDETLMLERRVAGL